MSTLDIPITSWVYDIGRSQQCCCLDGLHTSSYFQRHQSLYQCFGNCTERLNYIWYHYHVQIPLFFQSSSMVYELISLFALLLFYSGISRNGKVHYSEVSIFFFLFFFFFFFFWLSLGLVVWASLDDSFVSKNPKEFCASHFLEHIMGYA